ncbi:TlyA family RNA methyltransferase [Simiduia agarivorans]|uniref:Ribosomal RNA methyltransferase RrmJ/FtsJ n=1 Tax=Simiduia agarivorans (strain DSM 21679 / JCM 13881 / BCRC 17597 / SA1) TaxID=1117647 RepID=K4KN97_SIMAS|nr:SAM-dependent methyltransferase [Simiduia agarivorans]AFU99670.1 ribosomal RNA methyltransferase RrmJ/FtsJ [Simiduia agarivorans SA1 = DSM 21679]
MTGLTLLDMGQSTGGFTDCLLQAGAKKVVGVDVGCDQLDNSLRSDTRVVSFEGINGRELPADDLMAYAPDGFDGAVMDVSFISQTLLLPSLIPLIRPGGFLLSLVKPQFELQPNQIGKGGIVRNVAHYHLVEEKLRSCLCEHAMSVKDYFVSPIAGGDGNREFFVFAWK